ncbi:MAG: polyhydroxyalkanoic acid system family protein [Pyrinomonadaceae bacterium]
MPRYRTEVAHTLGQPEALARVRALAEYAGRTSDLKGAWSENTFEFSLTVQGVNLRGTLSVEPDALKFDGRLPLLAMPFRNWIPRALKKGLAQAGPGGSMSATPAGINAPGTQAEPAAPVVLFLHVPKAGGSTLGEYVYNQCRAPEPTGDGLLDAGVAYLDYGFIKEPELAVPSHVKSLLGRRDLRAVVGHFWFGLHEHVARPSTYVTLLRDPVERVVSLYYYAKLHETTSLEEFARTPPFKEVDNDQTRRIAGVNPPVGGCTRATLDAARENLRRHFAVVGTTERMEETLALLNVKLGWSSDVVSYPRNVNAARPATASLTHEAAEAVRARNELDHELWRYASELMDANIAAEGQKFLDELERYKALTRG